MNLSLVSPYDSILRSSPPKFDFFNPPCDPVELAHLLADFMVKHKGMGLAANQVGLLYNVFVMGREGSQVFACFNPRIVNTSVEQVEMNEGCLSFPGIYLNIKRPIAIKIRYTQPNGETVTKDLTGLTARIAQHEYEHLQGRLFSDHVSKLEFELAKNKAKKLLRRAKRG